MTLLIESPYDDFEQFLDLETAAHLDPGAAGPRVVPVLVQLVPPQDQDLNLTQHRHNVQSLMQDMAETFGTDVFSSDLDDLLSHLSDRAPSHRTTAFLSRLIIFVRMPVLGQSDRLHRVLERYASVMTPLWIGPRLEIGDIPPAAMSAPSPSDATQTDLPMIGIIDDGIGFLNSAFRNAEISRIDTLWLMKRPTRTAHGYDIAHPLRGAVDIDPMIAEVTAGKRLESEIYDALNQEVYAQDFYHATSRAVTHGTHMLGLTSARNSALPPGVRDILAVELPPFSVRDMTGHYLAFFAYLGLRLMLRRMWTASRGQARPRPLVVNISLGMLAGPKDNTGAFPREFLAEVDAYKCATGGQVTGVFAFGNAREDRQVAQLTLDPGATPSLDWRLQADDRTASFLELRGPADLEVSVEHLAGGTPASDFVAPAAGAAQDILMDGRVQARVYGNWSALTPSDGPEAAEGEWAFGASDWSHAPDGLIIALRPTHDHLRPVSDAPGLWRIRIRSRSGGTVTAQIQSGDTPPGYLRHGRQSYFEDPQPEAIDPVTEAGSYSAMIPVSDDHASVTALRWTPAGAPAEEMPYASKGGVFSLDRASEGEAVEDHFRSGGLRGLGTLSGTTARIGGTSAAAARHTRKLVGI